MRTAAEPPGVDELRAREQQSAGEGVAIPWCHDSRTLFHRTHYRASCSANTAIPRIIRPESSETGPAGAIIYHGFDSSRDIFVSPRSTKAVSHPVRDARRRIQTDHAPIVARIDACADAVADPWDTSRTTDSHAVADGLRRLLEETGILEALPGVPPTRSRLLATTSGRVPWRDRPTSS